MPAVNDLSMLDAVTLFRGLSSDQLSRLNDLLRPKTFPAGATFITADQPGDAVYVIGEGAVKVFVDDADGNEVILAILAPGEIVGEMSLLDSASRSANVVTLEETTVFWMNRAGFQRLLSETPIMQWNMTRLLCDRLRMANARVQSLALRDVEGRVAHQLLALAEIYGRANADGGILIPFRLTQGVLAGLTGATRVRVNQVVAAYKQRRYLSIDRNYHITIHNQDALGRSARYPCERPGAR